MLDGFDVIFLSGAIAALSGVITRHFCDENYKHTVNHWWSPKK
jgi:hypothetical protein